MEFVPIETHFSVNECDTGVWFAGVGRWWWPSNFCSHHAGRISHAVELAHPGRMNDSNDRSESLALDIYATRAHAYANRLTVSRTISDGCGGGASVRRRCGRVRVSVKPDDDDGDGM